MQMDYKKELRTEYASPNRSLKKDLDYQIGLFKNDKTFHEPLNHLLEFVAILNENREIVFCNDKFLELLDSFQTDCHYLGKRPGEVLNCLHALNSESGCGTTRFCRYCNVVNLILNSQKGTDDHQNCQIMRSDGGAWDLQVRTHHFEYQGISFVLFAALDMSHENRRNALERLFYHDVKNVAGIIQGFSKMMFNEKFTDDKKKEFQSIISRSSSELLDIIESQQMIQSAEDDTLETVYQTISINTLIKTICDNFSLHSVNDNKKIEFNESGGDINIDTDPVILGRVLGNMIKNALEAVKPGETVSIMTQITEDTLLINVQNPGEMSEEIKAQVFKRSFSTKGKGRGLGTYVIRLFTEKFLKGTARFTSDSKKGTCFIIELPVKTQN